MRTRFWLVLAALFIPVVPAHADDHSADMFAGFLAASGSTLWGFHQVTAIPFPLGKSDHKPWSAVSDLSAQVGSHDGVSMTRVTYLFGPRLTLSDKVLTGLPEAHFVHLQALVGGVRTNDAGNGGHDGAWGVGAAWEYAPAGGVNRGRSVNQRQLAFRVQADYVVVGGDPENFLRVSAGVTLRIVGD